MSPGSEDGRPTTRVVVATGNRHKVDEIRTALAFTGWDFVAAADLREWPEPEETGETFEENARIKAYAARELYGLPALADDSGLEVDALDGEPGVYSSRYAGPCATDAENNARLLRALGDTPRVRREARFRSVIVLVRDDGSEVVAEGACEGVIGTAPRGEGGFGYDPLFWPDAAPGRTMAELSMAEKNAISHRGAALRAMHDLLERVGEGPEAASG
ncbi:MAG: RdgB/HAM1 family non-canonical purine NTP pyrophosphatase [Anaerosomatales bacterium]|nr:RdgB/HAM1 family non-canonical purine NTP pyrophosphatase [Anaerosomatales bacterium]MDT8434452.1 RdgB/HAM1 family non-canonical purine NTP pyrophosphatase [Anaerosomatales bacterium]